MDIAGYLSDAGLADSTKELYRKHLHYVADWIEGEGLMVEELTGQHFDEYIESEHPEWSDSTVASALFAVRGYVTWAHGEGSGLPILRKKVKRRDPPPQRTLDLAEVSALFKSLDSSPVGIRDRALLQLMVHTGLRASEIVGLRLDAVDLKDRRFWVIQKGGRERWAKVPEFIVGDLRAWLREREQWAASGIETFFVSVGGTRPGTALTRDGLKSVCRYLAARAGLDHFSPHALRRTFATLYCTAGVNMKVIAAQGGWSSIQMVERYAKALGPEAMDEHFQDFSANGREP